MSNVASRIQEFNDRRDPFLLALKYEKMREDPFSFFRGSCHLFYEDLSKKDLFPDDTRAWICGDLHLENFGAYKGADGVTHYGIEDFDDAIVAPVTWEIMRALTSIHLAVGQFGPETLEKLGEKLADTFFDHYQRVMLAGRPVDVVSETIGMFINQATVGRKKKKLGSLSNVLDKPEPDIKVVKDFKATESRDSKTAELEQQLKTPLMDAVGNWLVQNNYKGFEVRDAARRITGTGSLGLERYIFLLENVQRQKEKEEDRYFLFDMKESRASNLDGFVTVDQPDWGGDQAERILAIQSGIQKVPPSFLEKSPPFSRKISFKGRAFVLKEVQAEMERIKVADYKDWRGKLDDIMKAYAEITASAHLLLAGTPWVSTVEELRKFFRNSDDLKSVPERCEKYAKQVNDNFREFEDDRRIRGFIRDMTGR
jgi:uncharacterized protein (DUF2252 family)